MLDSRSTASSILVDWIHVQIRRHPGIPILCVSGAQGIGKSTALKAVQQEFAGRVATLGIDDFYHTKAKRSELARTVHPLFEVRGPAGTHDLALLNATIDRLLAAEPNDETLIPVFDKRLDDRLPKSDWRLFHGRPKAVLLEGWCVGAEPDPNSPATEPINTVETRDKEGTWRAFQEAQLAGDYSELWDRADAYAHLQAPSFDQVRDWRIQQEETTLCLSRGGLPPERKAWVGEFIQHYERVTRRMLSGGRRRGYAIPVDADRSLVNAQLLKTPFIVCSDLDGTLLDHETYSFAAASEALELLAQIGATLVLASSKTAAEIEPLRAEMGFAHCPAIVENGAGVLEPGRSQDQDDSCRYEDIIAALAAAPREIRQSFKGFSDWTVEEVSAQTGLTNLAAANAKRRNFSEPGLWTGGDEAFVDFVRYITSHGLSAQRGGRFLTVSYGHTKADQLFEIASRFRPAPIIALGDAPNDFEMIQAANRGVIVKNPKAPIIKCLKGEATGRISRTIENGPMGWNRAIIEFVETLHMD